MSFSVRMMIAQAARINGRNMDLPMHAKAAALAADEVTKEVAGRVVLMMDISHDMTPKWHSISAWEWQEDQAPRPLPKTTMAMKQFVRDARGWESMYE